MPLAVHFTDYQNEERHAMQSSSVLHFFPAPSPSGSISTDSFSTGDTAIYGDAPAQDAYVYAQQQLQSPPQQLQLQLHELQLLVRPQSHLAHAGSLLREAPYGAADRRQTADLAGGSLGSNWSNRNKNGSSRNSNTGNTPRSVRRRISRACDQCNQLRTKCDGQHPCVHCVGAGLNCAYIRVRKKRGKASRRELAQIMADAAPAPGRSSDGRDDSNSSSNWTAEGYHSRGDGEAYMQGAPPSQPSQGLDDMVGLDSLGHLGHLGDLGMDSLESLGHLGDLTHLADLPSQVDGPPSRPAAHAIDLDGFDVRGHETGRDGSGPSLHATPYPTPPPPSLPLRYPVLAPLIPHLAGIVSAPAACDLVDAYFSRAASLAASLLPHGDPLLAQLPFALGLVVRRRALLHPTAPRPCRPALLASMLWVAATKPATATDDDSGGDDSTTLCQALRALAVRLLPPLLVAYHQTTAATTITSAAPTAASLPPSVDDVIACIHLAAGTPGDEGLPWWHAAWSLARRLQLGRERPEKGTEAEADDDNDEACEERRRVWWLAYMADRHLALWRLRPLFLLDAECADLRRPVADVVWQEKEGVRDTHEANDSACGPPTTSSSGRPGMYSTLLPLMVIVGETVDLLHARSHPLLGSKCGAHDATPQPPRPSWDVHATAVVTQHLAVYEQSLEPARALSTDDDGMATVYTTYAVHMVRVLRDLLASGWGAATTASLSVQPFGGRADNLGVKTE